MTTYNPNDFSPSSGKEINSQGNVVNPADGINADGSQNVQIKGRNMVVQQIIGTSDNTVSVSPSTSQYSNFINTSGFKSLSVFIISDQSYDITTLRSHDGIIADQGSSVATAVSATGLTSSRYHGSITTNNDAIPYYKLGIKNDSSTTAANIRAYLVGTIN